MSDGQKFNTDPFHGEAIARDFHQTIAENLRAGTLIEDFAFDQMFPDDIRELSSMHWTPVEVALMATQMMQSKKGDRILDIGSGCGKFCLVTALASGCEVVGMEIRPHLSVIAQSVAEKLKIKNVNFVDGDATKADWSNFDILYLYNPFYENVLYDIRIDDLLQLSTNIYHSYVQLVITKLKELKVGARVLTYHGFGGDFPKNFSLRMHRGCGTDYLSLWEKTDEET